MAREHLRKTYHADGLRAVGAMRVIEVLQALQADNFTIVKVS